MTDLAERIRAEATRLGFARVGFAEASRLDREALALDAWIEGARSTQLPSGHTPSTPRS